MNKEVLEILLQKYLEGTLTGEERLRLERWYLHQARSGEPLADADVFAARLREMDMVVFAAVLGREEKISDDGVVKQSGMRIWGTRGTRGIWGIWETWGRWVAVAAAVATVVFGVWFFNYKMGSQVRHDGRNGNDGLVANDVAPGSYGATIRLANGRVIQLDSAKKGVVVGGAAGLAYSDHTPVISNEESNLLKSEESDLLKSGDKRSLGTRDDGSTLSMMLTATTAKGQTYSFTLPDGSKVWLNADSKIEFPAQFSGKERRILLQGEAYFAVKHNAKIPFRVESRRPFSAGSNGGGGRQDEGQVVEDIGTEFNINAYNDEASMKTTLVAGSAAVFAIDQARHSDGGRQGVTLTPNRQAVLTNGKLSVSQVDVGQAIAWKNGFFQFDHADIKTVMRQLARWYNVKVEYEGQVPKREFTGKIYRNLNASEALRGLEFTGLRFRIKENTITVYE